MWHTIQDGSTYIYEELILQYDQSFPGNLLGKLIHIICKWEIIFTISWRNKLEYIGLDEDKYNKYRLQL